MRDIDSRVNTRDEDEPMEPLVAAMLKLAECNIPPDIQELLTFGNPSIATVRAQALVQASISAVEDIAYLGSDVMMMFADAKDRLEGAAHATGVGKLFMSDGTKWQFAAVA